MKKLTLSVLFFVLLLTLATFAGVSAAPGNELSQAPTQLYTPPNPTYSPPTSVFPTPPPATCTLAAPLPFINSSVWPITAPVNIVGSFDTGVTINITDYIPNKYIRYKVPGFTSTWKFSSPLSYLSCS